MKPLSIVKRLLVCSTLASLSFAGLAAEDFSSHARAPGWIGAYLSAADGGAKVEAVVRDSPADKGGLRAGDVVTQVNSKAVRSPADLSETARKTAVGDTLTLTVIRNTSEESVKVKVEARPGWFDPSGASSWGYSWNWPQGLREWREYLPPPKSWDRSEAVERLQKEMEKLRNQIDELRKRLDQHLSRKQGSSA